MSVICLVRHGQASFGAADYDRLSPLGHEQARVLGEALRARGVRPDAVVVGGHRRHRETAEGCLAALGGGDGGDGGRGAPAARESRDFDEYDHEDVLTRRIDRAAIAAADDPVRAAKDAFFAAVVRWTSGQHDDDYREPFGAFRARCQRGLAEVAAGLGRSRSALVFTSGGTISVLASGLLGLPAERALDAHFRLVNAGLTKVLVGGDGLALGSLNEHAHLERGDRRLITYR